MGQSWRDPQLGLVVLTQTNAKPLSKTLGVSPDVNSHIKHFALNHSNQFALGLRILKMQPPQDAFSGFGVVVLNKFGMPANGLIEIFAIKTLKEKASIVPKDLGL